MRKKIRNEFKIIKSGVEKARISWFFKNIRVL